tara:strand:- start:1199 stop:1429 length:231 start_codon:yes stop_codon:yes gene_type:complete
MKAKQQKEIKGIYYNEISENVYYVNKVEANSVRVSTVLINNNTMIKVLDDEKIIFLDVFKEFNFSGNYTREDINNL